MDKTASLARNHEGELVIKISFPYDLDLIMKIRTLTGRKYHTDLHCWSIPVNISSINQLTEWGFILHDSIKKYIEKIRFRETEIVISGIPGLKGLLYPFQTRGVAFIETNGGRALVADEMGLGKTIQTLAWIQLHPEKRPVIIVVPASVKLNWEREAKAWLTKPKTEILSGGIPWKTTAEILIINYNILPKWINELKRRKAQILVTDECHYYKSNKALRTKAIKKVGKGIPHVIALSGTPIVNRPIEAFNAISLINSDIFPNFFHFAHKYCKPKYNGFGWDFNGHSNEEELHKILTDSIMIRRLKKDVLPDLPNKVRSFIPLELDNYNEYVNAEYNFISYIKQTKGPDAAEKASNAEMLGQIEILKQLAVKGKLEQAIDWIQDFLNTDEKLVVFATHKFVISTLMEKFGKVAVKIDGSVTGINRQKAVDGFQNNTRIRLFIGNIQAAGIGITLTASSNVAFLELPWTPGELDQAEDRCHRIGQRSSVNIHYLLAINTIEEKIAKLLDSKRRVLDAVLDGKETDVKSLLAELIKSYE